MPFLKLRKTERTRLDTAYLGALMLFPHDKKAQNEAFEISITDIKTSYLSKNIKSGEIRSVKKTVILDLLETLQTGKPLQTLQDETVQPYKWGVATGAILFKFISESSVSAQKPLIGELVKDQAKSINVSEKTFNNRIFPRYKPVAHLWASYLDTAWRGDKAFPCRLINLEFFLALAEAYRIQGETLIPRYSKNPFLDPKKTWKVPKKIHLPHISLEFKAP